LRKPDRALREGSDVVYKLLRLYLAMLTTVNDKLNAIAKQLADKAPESCKNTVSEQLKIMKKYFEKPSFKRIMLH